MAFADAASGEAFSAWLLHVRLPPVDPETAGLARANSPLEAVCRVADATGLRCGPPEMLLYDGAARAIVKLVGRAREARPVAGASLWCREVALPWMGRALRAARDPSAGRAAPVARAPAAWDDPPDPEFARLCLLWFVLRCEYAPGNVLNGHAPVLCEQAGWSEGKALLRRFGRAPELVDMGHPKA